MGGVQEEDEPRDEKAKINKEGLEIEKKGYRGRDTEKGWDQHPQNQPIRVRTPTAATYREKQTRCRQVRRQSDENQVHSK